MKRWSVMQAETQGMAWGLIGVAMFSLTLPLTRVAVLEMNPLFVAIGRAALAGLMAVGWLLYTRARLPSLPQLRRLAIVAVGVVYGFPVFSALAMQTLPAAHGAIVLGILPLATAVVGALRFRERPSPAFWAMAVLGTVLVICYALYNGGGGVVREDVWLLLAIISAALGYSEGGKLSEHMSATAVISWVLILTLPLNLALTWHAMDFEWRQLSSAAVYGFVYVGVISMYVGFMFWYKGLAMGGVARVGQVQLLQPFLSLFGAYAVLGEPITMVNVLFASAVLLTVVLGKRTAVVV
jgi:drug/metabolite transporter (DMT)-like permease